MKINLETVEGPKEIEIKPLGGVTATMLLSRLLKKFGKPLGKYMQANKGMSLLEVDLDSLPLDILDEAELTYAMTVLLSKSTVDGKVIDPDALFVGCSDSLLKASFAALKLNFGASFSRLVSAKPTP